MLSLNAPLGAGWMRLERKGRGMGGVSTLTMDSR